MADTIPVYPPVPLPSAPVVLLAPNLSLQPPLSRRGHGPGLIVVDPGYDLQALPSAEPPSQTLDPAPQYKWAEEGYAVVRLTFSNNGERTDLVTDITKAIDSLNDLEECDVKNKYALLSRVPKAPLPGLAHRDSQFMALPRSTQRFSQTKSKPLLLQRPVSWQPSPSHRPGHFLQIQDRS